MNRLLGCAAVAAAALAAIAAAPASPRAGGSASQQYIVVLKGPLPLRPTAHSEHAATVEDEKVAASVGAKPKYLYNADLKGFAAHLTEQQLAELQRSPQVAYVERDEPVQDQADHLQVDPPWDLDRIDQTSLPLDRTYRYSSEGAGVTIYVLDTGIQVGHPDFGSRARSGYSFESQTADLNGHGTHVAGIAAGTKWGVAKLATLVSVRVLNSAGSGTTAGVIAGMNWIAANHVPDKSVTVMSLGGGVSLAMDDATNRLVEGGVFVSAAAGNENRSACNVSPARAAFAFTVAASDATDRKASFSNYGPCVDAYAPGVHVPSDWIGGGEKTISGTSMAAPIVAGIAALYLSHHASTPAETTAWIDTHATHGVIQNNLADTANRLVDKADL